MVLIHFNVSQSWTNINTILGPLDFEAGNVISFIKGALVRLAKLTNQTLLVHALWKDLERVKYLEIFAKLD